MYIIDSTQNYRGTDETFVPAIKPEFCVFISIASTINAAIRQHKARMHMNTIHAPKTIKRQLPGCEASEDVYDNATLQSRMNAEDTTRTRSLHEVRSMLDARELNSALFEKSMLFDVRSSLSAAEYDDW